MARRSHHRRSGPAKHPEAAPRTPEPRGSSRSTLVIVAALVALNLVVFAQVARYPFSVIDDPVYVSQNPNINDRLSWQAVGWAFTSLYAANWHPITWLSHAADVQLFGLDPGPQHLVNLAIHIINTVVLFLGLRALTRAAGASALVAALFAVHPLHVESVAWISERKDVLSTLAWWVTIGAYVRYVRAPSRRRFALVMILYALGLMTKPMLVSAPFGLLLLDVWPLGRARWPWISRPVERTVSIPWRQLVGEKIPLFILAAGSTAMTLVAQRAGGAVVALVSLPVSRRLANALMSYVQYLVKTVWPSHLSVFYPYPASIDPVWLISSIAVLLAVTFVAVRAAERRPYVLAGWLWYLVTLAPVIGIVQVGSQSMADRYTYVPLVGVFIAVVWSVDAVLRESQVPLPARVAPALAVVAACAVVAYRQTTYWSSSERLWQHALDAVPGNPVALRGLATLREADGKSEEAFALYKQAFDAAPDDPGARHDLADAHVRRGVEFGDAGRFNEAVAELRDAVRLEPDASASHAKLGLALMGAGRSSDAIPEFRTAIRLDPSAEESHMGLGFALASAGDLTGAGDEFKAVLRRNPGNASAARALAEITRRIK